MGCRVYGGFLHLYSLFAWVCEDADLRLIYMYDSLIGPWDTVHGVVLI